MSSRKNQTGRGSPRRSASPWWLPFFFAVFALAGLLMAVFWAWPAATEAVDSKNWKPVPATVVESSVERHTGSDSTTYSINIVFSYTIDGRSHQSDRWSILGGSSSGYNSKQRVVDEHPPGREITAYVNPDLPDQAVINPGLDAWALMFLIPVVFFFRGCHRHDGEYF